MSDKNNCVKNALMDAGIKADGLPDHQIDKRAMPYIAEKYGIQFHGAGYFEADADEPIIAIYETTPGRAHAVYHEQAKDALTDRTVHGVITFRGKAAGNDE